MLLLASFPSSALLINFEKAKLRTKRGGKCDQGGEGRGEKGREKVNLGKGGDRDRLKRGEEVD